MKKVPIEEVVKEMMVVETKLTRFLQLDHALTDHYRNTHKPLLDALKDVLEYAIILSKDYLGADYIRAFNSYPTDHCIQGWEKKLWMKTAVAGDKAREAIEAASFVKVEE